MFLKIQQLGKIHFFVYYLLLLNYFINFNLCILLINIELHRTTISNSVRDNLRPVSSLLI